MHLDLTLTIVFIFLLLSLISAHYTSNATKTFKQFAVGDQKYTPSALVITLICTTFGGGFLFRDLEMLYTDGLYYGLHAIACCIGYFVISRYLVPRMGGFMHHLSIAESIGSLFGNKVRIITAISGILFAAGVVAIQLQAITKAITLCCHIEGKTPAYMAIGIVLLYSILGGIKVITFTHVIQFITFTTLLPLLISLVNGTNPSGCESIAHLLTTHKNFDLNQIVQDHRFINTLLLVLGTAIPSLQPAIMQRMYMTKHIAHVRASFFYTGIIGTVVKIIVLLLGTALLTQHANLNPKALLDHILTTQNEVWLSGFVCIGILALAMTTADANLHIAGVLFTNDLLFSLPLTDIKKLLLSRLFSLLTIILGLWLAFYIFPKKDLFSSLRVIISVYMPIVSVPFLMAIFGFRPRSEAVLLAMGAGALTVIAFQNGLDKYLTIQDGILPAMLMNGLCLVGAHYLLPKVAGTGWVGMQHKTAITTEKKINVSQKKPLKSFSFTCYLKAWMPKYNLTFVALGVYCLITHPIQLESHRINLMVVTMLIGLSTAIILCPMVKAYDATLYTTIMTYSYPWLIFILLFLSSGYMLRLHCYSKLATQLFLTNVVVALCLLPGRIVGTLFAITLLLIKYSIPYMDNDCILIVNRWMAGRFFYSLILFTIIYILTLYWKNEFKPYNFDLFYLNGIYGVKSIHLDSYLSSTPMVGAKVTDELTQQKEALIDHTAHPLIIERKTINIKYYITNVIKKLTSIDDLIEVAVHQYTPVSTICGDPIRLSQLFTHGVQYLIDRHELDKSDIIYIHIMDTSIQYTLDEVKILTKTIPALAFVLTTNKNRPVVKEVYQRPLDHVKTEVPSNTNDHQKQSIIPIIDAHRGCFSIDKDKEPFHLALYLVLPID